jgi:hypothetical protein
MALNLLITTSHTSSHRMLLSLDYLAHTHHLQMGRLSVCFAPSITPSGHSLFTRSYLQHTRLMLYPQPCTSLIDCHPPKHQTTHPFNSSITNHPHVLILRCLVAFAILTSPPQLLINFLLARYLVFFLATLHLTKLTDVSIW